MIPHFVKICGLRDTLDLKVAIEGGAGMVGFVLYSRSPRFVSLKALQELIKTVSSQVKTVGLFVNAEDRFIETILEGAPLDILQLHGNETPLRVKAIKERFKKPLIKALPIGTAQDLEKVQDYAPFVDWILLDATPAKEALYPGGHGVPFDWSLLKGFQSLVPWLLAGGLNSQNIQEAIAKTHPDGVDVSSGVEVSKGVKSQKKIKDFLKAVQGFKP